MLARILRLASIVICLIAIASFVTFALDQTSSASNKQQAKVNQAAPRGGSTSGSSKPARVHMRDPSFVNLQSFRDMAQDSYVADMICSLGMLDPILGGVDR